jgi:hypothetical protein
MEPVVVDARPLPRHRVWLRFSDGVTGEVDLSHLVGRGLFARLHQPGEFERLSVDREAGTIVWPGGLDVAPDALYERIVSRAHAAS